MEAPFKVLYNNVCIDIIKHVKKSTIINPLEDAKIPVEPKGLVVAIGEDVKHVAVGDKVKFHLYDGKPAGMWMDFGVDPNDPKKRKQYLLIRDTDISCVFQDEPDVMQEATIIPLGQPLVN